MQLRNKTSYQETIEFAFNQFSTEAIDGELVVILDENSELGKESYQLEVCDTVVTVKGSDRSGCMYGVLDVVEMLSYGKEIKALHGIAKTPYIQNRGIKFNIPLDARTPSYSDSSDSAQQNISNMWEFSFWEEFLDNLARNKYNVLSLWNLHPFPSMVKTKGYEEVALEDVAITATPIRTGLEGRNMSTSKTRDDLVVVKKFSMDEKITFWRNVMEYAASRCIKLYVFTWNIFVFGTEHTDYGITSEMENQTTKDYFRKTITAMLETYPLLAGIGVTAGEAMSRTAEDTKWLWETYGKGINDALEQEKERDFLFIHRAHFTSAKSILDAFSQLKCPMDYSFKYSQAHMYVNTNPVFGKEFFEEIGELKQKTWLTVRNDDYYMYRWGNPEFAKEYLRNMPHEVLKGFYMGPDGYTWGVEYLTKEEKLQNRQVLTKMWYMLKIWGQLAYDIEVADEHFVEALSYRFPEINALTLYNAWKNASKIIPTLQCTRWYALDFQWYPEGCVSYCSENLYAIFRSIRDFMTCKEAPGSGYVSVSDFCHGVKDGISPLVSAEKIMEYSMSSREQALELLESDCDCELKATSQDIIAMSYLGEYYSLKIEAAVYLLLWKLGKEDSGKDRAVELLKKAYEVWCTYATYSTDLYKPQLLTRMTESIDLMRYCHNAKLDISIAMYEESC